MSIEAITIGITASAQMSIAVLRDRLIVQPILDHPRRNIAAADAADVRNDVDHRDRQAEGFEVEAVLLLQEIGQPEKIDPPDRIGQKFADRKCPRLAMRNSRFQGILVDWLDRIALDVCKFFCRKPRMFFGTFVDDTARKRAR